MALTERVIFTYLITIILFMLLAYDLQFGIIFVTFLFANVLFSLLDNKITFHIEKQGNNRLETILWALGGFFIFVLLSPVLLRFFSIATSGLQSILELFSQYTFSQLIPSLAGNPYLDLIGFGIVVVIVETVFFNGRLYEAITDHLNINTATFNLKNILVAFFVIPGIATAFHFSVRGVTELATPGLLLTFIFFAISQFMVIKRRQIMDAIGMHAAANITATSLRLGLKTLSPALLSVIAVVVLVSLTRLRIFQKIFQRF